jgi:heme exporter protein A
MLRTLASLAQPSEGEIWLDGRPVRGYSTGYKRRIGFVSHATLLYDDLTVRENLRLAGTLFGLVGLERKIDALLERFSLRDRDGDLVRTLSRGLQQRVTLARALLHEPDFVLLDEPFTGLDTASVAGLEEILRHIPEQGGTAIFSTHNFAQGASIAGRLVVLEKGRVRYDGPISGAPWLTLRIPPEEAVEYRETRN